MSITDELREFLDGADGYELWCPHHKKELTAIADSIDAALEEGYIELPKDANGVPIRIGDSIETLMGEDGTCVAIELCEDGGWNVSLRPFGWDTPTLFAAESVRHAQPDSWERIIEDAGELGYDWFSTPMGDEVHAEKIGRLVERCKRLAGEGA